VKRGPGAAASTDAALGGRPRDGQGPGARPSAGAPAVAPSPASPAPTAPPTAAERSALDVADAVMLAVVAIWAANNVVVKATLDELSPLAYVGGRFAIVVGLLFAWLAARHSLRPIARADWPALLLTGLTGYAAYNVLFTLGLDRTSAFSVAVLISLGPVFTLLIASALGGERVRPLQWAGVACAAVGVGVFVGDKLQAGAPAGGDVLSLLAALAFSVYSLATQPLVRRYGAPAATAWSALVGLVAAAPWVGPAMAEQDWAGLSPGGWASLLYASAISMLAAYTMWAWAISRRGAGRTVPYLYLVPIATGVLAALFLGEGFGPLKVAGGVLVLFGVGLVRSVGSVARLAEGRARWATRSG
jgi:drug/metabolite transporter (DMT)-like permease